MEGYFEGLFEGQNGQKTGPYVCRSIFATYLSDIEYLSEIEKSKKSPLSRAQLPAAAEGREKGLLKGVISSKKAPKIIK